MAIQGSLQDHTLIGGRSVARPKKYLTEQERREAIRQSHRKYVEANRVAIRARQAERDRKRRAPIKSGQKETSAAT